jgi:hypothetical protein
MRTPTNAIAHLLIVDIINKLSELNDLRYNPRFKRGYIDIPYALRTLKEKVKITCKSV